MKFDEQVFEEKVKEVFREYLELHGLGFSDKDIEELADIYTDCLDYQDDVPVNGRTEVEMVDWIKHTGEAVRICGRKEKNGNLSDTVRL